jgi:hypothetical protein
MIRLTQSLLTEHRRKLHFCLDSGGWTGLHARFFRESQGTELLEQGISSVVSPETLHQ